MFQMLKSTMIRQPSEEDPDEGIKDLVETMIKRMVKIMLPVPKLDINIFLQDFDHDSKVSLEDYITSIKKEPLLIEGFGPCLPSPDDVTRFNTLIFSQ